MKARQSSSIGLTLAVSLLLSAPLALAAEPAATPAAAAPTIDPTAVAALDRMGQALRGLDHFSLTSDTTLELVLESGQKVDLDGTVSYKVAKPAGMFVEIKSDRRQREFYFDGKDLTINSPRLGLYASTPVEARTLSEFVINASEKYGINFPLADLFYWGTEHAPKDVIQTATHIGKVTVDGAAADHYAFTQEGAHWQVWITEAGSLPVKLVITSQADPALPQYRARLHWDTKTPVQASSFKFTPAKDSQRIALAADAVSADAKEEN
jgi:hypothetical protein